MVSERGKMDVGLLILRLGIGATLLYHGVSKLVEGPEKWEHMGQALGTFGITVVPTLWGILACAAECLGGLALIVGLLFRPFCVILLGVMAVAAAIHLGQGEPLYKASHALRMAVVYLSLLFIGPGRFSLRKSSRKPKEL
jgi:putative oxidoreductase